MSHSSLQPIRNNAVAIIALDIEENKIKQGQEKLAKDGIAKLLMPINTHQAYIQMLVWLTTTIVEIHHMILQFGASLLIQVQIGNIVILLAIDNGGKQNSLVVLHLLLR